MVSLKYLLFLMLILFTVAYDSSRLLSSRDARTLPELFGVDDFWRKARGLSTKIAILDTGIDSRLIGETFKNVVTIEDFSNENSTEDNFGHGTFITGIIAGHDSYCPGFAPQAQLHILKIFNKHGGNIHSQLETRNDWLIAALDRAKELKVDLINLSNGGLYRNDTQLQEKIEELVNEGIVVVAAAGNEGPEYGTINSPADLPGVIAVGSVSFINKKVSSFSSRGFAIYNQSKGIVLAKPDALTFGEGIMAVDKDGTCKSRSGTSCSAAILCGVIAAAISFKRIINESYQLTPGQYLFSTSIDLKSSYLNLLPFSMNTPSMIKVWAFYTSLAFLGSLKRK